MTPAARFFHLFIDGNQRALAMTRLAFARARANAKRVAVVNRQKR
jgi:hypothetical protein